MNIKLQESFTEIYDKIVGWATSFIENVPNLLVAVIVMILSYYVARFVNKWTVRIASKRIPQTSITKLMGKVTATIVISVGLVLALGALDLNKTLNTILAGAGISGLVIGLALQSTLSNMLSGIILSFRRKIQIGHWIETNGFSGEVVDISLHSLIVKEFDNNLVIIPNKTIIDKPLKNFSITNRMRIAVDCGVGYESDLNLVEQLVKEAIGGIYQQHEGSEIEVYFKEFGESSIHFVTRFWVDATDAKNRLEAKSVAIMAIKKKFNANDINIPFPIRTLQFENNLNLNKVNTNESILQN